MAEPKSVVVTPELHAYAVAHGTPPDEVQRSLIEVTAGLGSVSGMQISPDQGAFMTLLTKIVGVRFAVEVGTFTGYSSICIARGLATGGRLLCCDVSEEWTAIARDHWDRAGVAERIDLRIAPAIETLRALPADPPIDLAFIDADKPGYVEYYEEIVARLRPGGVVLLDNVLWSGVVADPTNTDENTVAIRAVNDRVAADDRVEAVVLPIADGLTIARKR
ncbi:MAG: class I SAM-dependent methyltransferase [Sporichthyaceae bacterium]|jgi:caffeoyl-CoA O-methyltransferase|nr:class I SAM-dependent methyltransferase [Sporichthyaceae bacterium]